MRQVGSSNRYREVETLYQRAMDLPADRRDAFLGQACGDDVALRREVEVLIRHYDAAGDSFLQPVDAKLLAEGAPLLPERIGGYQIVRLVGQGGMGIVFEARQDNPRRSVAVKAIRPGLASPRSLRRFKHEAAVLGRLQHPGIAHVYEAGIADLVADTGLAAPQPFFAMEFIHGAALGEYVREKRLGMRERLELFARICDAVEHAHQKGIIHRDLKPSNILVNDAGHPKILDFGVARVTDADLQLTTMHTEVAQVVGTLPYMSPEQVAGHADRLDTRSDVYSLGVILYELLAGRLPYDLTDKPLAAAARVISEQPPTPLHAISRNYRGDLDTIAQKALQKDPSRRYGSAHALAADVRHYVNREPISARRPSLLYHLAMFARRRRGLVVGAALLVLALVAGAAAAGWQALRATRAERIARAVNDFLNEDLLAAANPFNEPDRDLRLRDVLNRASERIEGRFGGDPLAEAAVRQTLGVTYRGLGELQAAEGHLRRALEIAQSEAGESDRQTIRLALELGEVLRQAIRYDEAEELWRFAANQAERAGGSDDPDALEARSNLGVLALDRNRVDEAEAILRETLAKRRAVLGDDHGASLVSMSALGSVLERQGQFAEAEALYVECVERSRRALGPEHPDTMTAVSNLGLLYTRLDRFEEAEPFVLEALELRKRVLGEEHPATLVAMNNVGYFYSLQSRFEECAPYYTRVYEIRLQRFGPEHPDTLLSMSNLGWLYAQMQRWDEAEQLLTELVEVSRRAQPNSLDLSLSVQMLGGFLLRRGQIERAEPLLREALEGFRVQMPEGDWRIGAGLSTYGNCLRQLGRYEEAERAMLEGYERQSSVLGPHHRQTRLSVQALVNLYTDWGKPDQVEAWQARLDP